LKRWQWAPFFIVTAPELAQHLCIVPIRRYANLYSVVMRGLRGGTRDVSSRLHSREDHFQCNDLLAPYAVHKNDLYAALVSLVDAMTKETAYINPTNGLVCEGWRIPDPDTTVQGLFKVHNRRQVASRDAIERLAEFMKGSPDMRIAINPIGPLVCDFFLIDERDNVSYNIEHKSLAHRRGTENVSASKVWLQPTSNLHFLLVQCGDTLAVYTRPGKSELDSATPTLIDMASPVGSDLFTNIIRGHGGIAKARLRSKWKSTEMYDDSIPLDNSEPVDDDTSQVEHRSTSGDGTVVQCSLVYRDRINRQCCNLRLDACIPLTNHPCADAAVVEHFWTESEVQIYRSSGLLPVSLTTTLPTSKKCILLRFVSHGLPRALNTSTSRLFELDMGSSIEIPNCTAQHFIYIVMTGGIPGPNQLPDMDTVALLPSMQTTILDRLGPCICDSEDIPRERTAVRTKVLNADMKLRNEYVSFYQSPFLCAGVKPLQELRRFDDGSVHRYFRDLFSRNEPGLITSIHGPAGILQRQWNHGDMREVNHFRRKHPTYGLLGRILNGWSLPHDMSEHPLVAEFGIVFEKFLGEFRKIDKRPERVVKMRTLRHIIQKTDRGISLRELVALSGFATDFELHCDHCTDEKTCKFLHPEIAYAALGQDDYSCGNCPQTQNGSTTCTIRQFPPELLQQLRTFTPFRAHVPCHGCWRDGKICDNNAGSCHNCTKDGMVCQREACVAFCEDRDTWVCPRDCDKAHHDDGYTNVTDFPREQGGYNGQLAARKAVAKGDSRVAICNDCWNHAEDDLCTNEHTCPPCEARIQNGESITCERPRCREFVNCTRTNCTFAHATQAFLPENVVDHEKRARRNLKRV